MRLVTIIGLIAIAAACNDNHDGGDDTPDGGTAGLVAPPDGEGLQLRQAYSLASGDEVHNCQYYVLPEADAAIGRFEHAYTSGGHHVILYPTELDPADLEPADLEVFDCDLMPNRGDAGFAYAAAGTYGQEVYPDRVARRFPGRVILLESHMLNTSDDPLEVDYRMNLWFATGEVVDEVGTIFFYDNHVYLPAGGQATAKMACEVPAGIQVSALAPHMHVRGTRFRAFLAGGALAEPEPLLETLDWSVTEPTRFDPPLEVGAGQRFEFDCDYRNPDGSAVIEGPSKTDNEMCLLIGTYWPRIDVPFELCMGPGSGSVLEGSATCAETFACLTTTADPVAAEACAVDTCASSSPAFNDFFSCVALECFFADRCEDGSCQSCVTERCSPTIGACQAAGC
jgi:hypothetical protein